MTDQTQNAIDAAREQVDYAIEAFELGRDRGTMTAPEAFDLTMMMIKGLKEVSLLKSGRQPAKSNVETITINIEGDGMIADQLRESIKAIADELCKAGNGSIKVT